MQEIALLMRESPIKAPLPGSVLMPTSEANGENPATTANGSTDGGIWPPPGLLMRQNP
jgi:hypothetical protein